MPHACAFLSVCRLPHPLEGARHVGCGRVQLCHMQSASLGIQYSTEDKSRAVESDSLCLNPPSTTSLLGDLGAGK